MKIFQDSNGIVNLTMTILVIVLSTVVLFYTVSNLPYVEHISFRWYQGAGFAVIALMAQMFFKLNDIREQSKVSEVAFNKLQTEVRIKSSILLKVIIFYFLSLIVNVILISVAESGDIAIWLSNLFRIICIAYIPAWMLSVINSYHVYLDISEYKAELALKELQEAGRKSAVDRLTAKSNLLDS